MVNRNKIRPKWLTNNIEEFFRAVLKLRSTLECEKFFRDLMTIQEIKTFAARLKVARMLEEGQTYKEIEKQTGMSSTTIARINRWLEYGEGGYKLVLRRMKRSK